jgi:autotransporter-associated beta strand protein
MPRLPMWLRLSVAAVNLAVGTARLRAAAVTWDAGGGANLGWSYQSSPGVYANWSDDADPAGDSITFGNLGVAATAGTTTNSIGADLSVAALTYANNGATSFHTTQIDSGATLTVAGPFTVGQTAVSNVPTQVTIRGSSPGTGALVVNTTGDIRVGTYKDWDARNVTLDLSGLGTFTATADVLYVGYTGGNGGSTTWKLAAVNTITATDVRMAYWSQPHYLYFGQANTVNADFVGIGYQRNGDVGSMLFNSGLTNPTLTLRNRAGTGRMNLTLGDAGPTDNVSSSGTINLTAGAGRSAGSLDALLGTVLLGGSPWGGHSNVDGTGTLAFSAGTVDATLIRVGMACATGGAGGRGIGYLTVGGTGTLTADTITVADRASDSGPNALGTVTLDGGTIRATTIQRGANNGVPALTWNSGTLTHKTGTDLAVTGIPVTLVAGSAAHTFHAEDGRTITVDQPVAGQTGTGGLRKTGAGLLVLTGDNTFTGTLAIAAGTVRIGSGAGSGALACGQVLNNGTLEFHRGSGTTTFAGIVSGDGDLVKSGDGVLELATPSSYTGATRITGGTLRLLPAPTAPLAGSSIWLDATDLNGNGLADNPADGSKVGLWVNKGSLAGINASQGNASLQPVVDTSAMNGRDAVTFTRPSASTSQYLEFNHSAIATLVNNPHTLYAVARTATGGGDSSTNATQAVVMYPGWHSGLGFSGYPSATGAYGTQWVGGTSSGGTRSLGESLPYALGETGILGMTVTGSTAAGPSSFQLFYNGSAGALKTDTLQLTNYTNNVLRLGTAHTSGTYTWGLTGDIAEVLVYNSVLSAADRMALERYLAFKWQYATSNLLPAGTALEISGNGVLDLNGATTTIGSLAGTAGAQVSLGSATLTAGGNNTSTEFAGAITGSGGLVKTGGGTLTLSGDSLYTGATTVAAGTLEIGAGGASGSLDSDMANSGTLRFRRGDRYVFGNAISGAGTVEQRGPGTLVFDTDQLYSGPTVVSGGTLLVNGALPNSSSVTVQAGATLGGTGSIGGPVTIAGTPGTGAVLAPGASIGTLTIGTPATPATTVLGADSTLQIETGPSGADRLVVYGDLDLTSAGNTLHVAGLGAPFSGTVVEVMGGSLTGSFETVTWSGLLTGVTVTYTATTIDIVAVPEPGALALLAALAAFAGAGRCRPARRPITPPAG